MTLGILGGGQLGRMTAQAALRLGLDVRILTDAASGPEGAFAHVTVADWTDPDTLAAWADGCDGVTAESEWAPVDRLPARAGLAVWPTPDTLRTVRHKGRQRDALAEAGLAQPPYRRCPTLDAARAARHAFGAVVAKRYQGSYDGYGNATCHTDADLDAAWDGLAADDGLLIEGFVDFQAELAVQVVRGADGDTEVYPVCRSEQRDHRCHAVEVPSGIAGDVEMEAQRVAVRAVEAIGMVGVATAELFLTADGGVLVNELAPRPHNSGHYTIEASHTSQFENHVRAVCGLALGEPGLRVPAACMVNVLGDRQGDAAPHVAEALADVPEASVHVYGKRAVRPRRKMGHVTVTAPTVQAARSRAETAASRVRF